MSPLSINELAEVIHNARFDVAANWFPFSQEDRGGRDYCFRLARAVSAARAARNAEPSPALLMSIAIRGDHALGVPGYYDDPMFAQAGVTHARRLEVALSEARGAWEEVVGLGFYSPERNAWYLERMEAAKVTPSPDRAGSIDRGTG